MLSAMANMNNTHLPSFAPNWFSFLCIYFFSSDNIFNMATPLIQSWDSSVGIATGYGLGDQGVGVRVPVEARIFTSPCRPDRLWGARNLLSNGNQGLSPGVKRPERETDHSPPTGAEVKKTWIYIYIHSPPYVFME
jgi:hypothetical protein